jgi:Flp pilus assembly protein TadB
MARLFLLFRGGRRWQEDATALVPRTKLVGVFLAAGVVLWLVTLLTARHHLLAGPIHVVLVLAFACLLVLLSGRGKGVLGDVRQLRAVLSILRLRPRAPWWQHAALRAGCIVLGVRRKDG